MQQKFSRLTRMIHPARLSEMAAFLLRDEAISGKLILLATAAALLAVNTVLRDGYETLWHTQLSVGLGNYVLTNDLRHWVNDGLMALFFLVVGLEIKRELVHGELRRFKTASLPIAAAAGGMVVPALIYLAFNAGSPAADGWAIVMATDIAFAVGILSLLGKRVPVSIRLFLLTLAIVDDIGAVIIIALFYNTGLNLSMLVLAAAIVVSLRLWRRLGLLTMPLFVISGIAIWLAFQASGVHASISGALLGLLAPLAARRARQASIAERLERATIPVTTLVVIPLFAFANTGIVLSLASFRNDAAVPMAAGIILGLVAGKLIGIVSVSWLMVRLGWADLPRGASWRHIIGVGLLCGIGFTVSIFVTELAFADGPLVTIAKISVFAASGISAALGLLAFTTLVRKRGRSV